MRTNTQQTITAALLLAMAFTFNACSSNDDDGGSSGGGGGSLESLLESLLANDYEYQLMKKRLEYYDPDDSEERCTAAGVVERMCGDEWYNPLKQYCAEGDDDTYEVGTVDVCGSQPYFKFPSGKGQDKCENNVVLSRCEDSEDLWYNGETQECNREYSNGQPSYSIVPIDPTNLCNGVRFIYSEGSRECRDGVVKRSCGDIWYNEDTEYCDWKDGNKVKSKMCGGIYVGNPAAYVYGYARCTTDGKTFEGKCGYDDNAPWYNPITQVCNEHSDGTYTIKNKIKCSK